MMEYCVLPTRAELRNGVVEFLADTKKETSTSEINEYIINRFNISSENTSALTDDGTTTIFAYRMCWIRTDLKKEGIIESQRKGYWQIKK